ncbi:hypothetical protein IKQ19_09860 [Candidatus Saccharibacteria bacterium]|nr:hypothetical protein [Candidatus Saccharibacteria bacterium]
MNFDYRRFGCFRSHGNLAFSLAKFQVGLLQFDVAVHGLDKLCAAFIAF